MATIKISELEEVTELSSGDVLPIVNNNETKKVSIEKLNEILGGSGESGSGSVKMLVIEFDNNLKTFDTDTNKAILTEYYNSIRNDEFVELFIAFNRFSGAESGDSPYWYRASVMELDDSYLKLYCPPYINTNQSQNINGINYHEMRELAVTASVQTSDENYSIASITYYYTNSWALNGNNKILGMNNTTAFTPTGDYNPATKKYVDDAIANIDIPEGGESGSNNNEIYDIITTNSLTADSATLSDTLGQFTNVMSKYIAGEITTPTFRLKTDYYKSNTPEILFRLHQVSGSSYKYDAIQIKEYSSSGFHIYKHLLTLNVDTSTGNVTSATITNKNYRILVDGISKSYTPTKDYHPSTKKYVDDSIAAAITTVLGAEY